MNDDDLGFDEETPREQIARLNMEADLAMLAMLRQIREDRGLSQTELGELLGVSQASVSAFESETDPKLSTVRRYAHALCATITHHVEPQDTAFNDARWQPRFRTPGANLNRSKQVRVEMGLQSAKRTDFAMAA
ncbi:helix-turn-helix domain-containing protein [Microbacterium mitrae]|nr:helix-turn-helix domain-containing protein [Microbacterium mitrae]